VALAAGSKKTQVRPGYLESPVPWVGWSYSKRDATNSDDTRMPISQAPICPLLVASVTICLNHSSDSISANGQQASIFASTITMHQLCITLMYTLSHFGCLALITRHTYGMSIEPFTQAPPLSYETCGSGVKICIMPPPYNVHT